MSTSKSTFDAIGVARRVIETEKKGLDALSSSLDSAFIDVLTILQTLKGRTILAGVGKSGHVARKIAATFSSTGTTSLFVHPTEASHGDMGMITQDDAVIALSRSGETKELADITMYCKRFAVPLIAMTCKKASSLGRAADYLLLLPDADEACCVTGAPTTSTTLQMAMGDALAVALLEARGFTVGDFKTFHPGGTLGAQLASAGDLMHNGERIPLIASGQNIERALHIMDDKGFGCVGIIDDNGMLVGIITDGDIRRNFDKKLPKANVRTVMTKHPKTITPDMLAADVMRFMTMKAPKIMQVFVLEGGKPVGILHMHDLLRAGLA